MSFNCFVKETTEFTDLKLRGRVPVSVAKAVSTLVFSDLLGTYGYESSLIYADACPCRAIKVKNMNLKVDSEVHRQQV